MTALSWYILAIVVAVAGTAALAADGVPHIVEVVVLALHKAL